MSQKPEPKWEFQCNQFVDFENIDCDDDSDTFFGSKAAASQHSLASVIGTMPGSTQSLKTQPRGLLATGSALRRSLRVKSSSGDHTANIENVPTPQMTTTKFGLKQEQQYKWKDIPLSPVPMPLSKKKRLSQDYVVPKKRSPLGRLHSHGSAHRQNSILHRARFGNVPAQAVRGPMRAFNCSNVPATADEPEDLSSKCDFVANLRCYDAPKQGIARHTTIPSPFSFASKQQDRQAASKATQPFRSVAEQVASFQTKTPQRFRTRAGGDRASVRDPSPAKPVPIVLPQTPKLLTKQRQRPTNIPSIKDLEDKELDDMKKSQFHANPFNPSVFGKAAIGVPEIVPKPPTVVAPFSLSVCNQQPRAPLVEVPVKFQAKPVPRAVLEPPKDLRILRIPYTTSPKSPAFALRSRLGTRESSARDAQVGAPAILPKRASFRGTSSFARPVTSAGASSMSEWTPREGPIKVQPFSFDQQVKQLPLRKQKRLEEVLERERREREFRARPNPDFSAVTLPPKESKPATRPAPFDLKIESRGAAKEQKIQKLIDEEKETLKKLSTFKAKPCNVIYENPFLPERSDRPLTVRPELHLATEQRAVERKCYDEELKAREAKIAAQLCQREQLREAEELAKVAEQRKNAVHKAQPVPHYRPFEIRPCDRSPINPVSPNFATKKRKRTD